MMYRNTIIFRAFLSAQSALEWIKMYTHSIYMHIFVYLVWIFNKKISLKRNLSYFIGFKKSYQNK